MLKFVMYLFYRYYSKGRGSAYFSALVAVVFQIYLHIFQLLIVIDHVDLLPMRRHYSHDENAGKLALFFLPVFLLVACLVKPSDLKKVEYPDEKIQKGGAMLVAYCILNVLLFFTIVAIFPRKTTMH